MIDLLQINYYKKYMKTNKLISAFLLVLFWALLYYSYYVLPNNVAIHFSNDGSPNRWMNKSSYLILFGFGATFLTIVITGMFYLVRYFPKEFISIPYSGYWLAPERFEKTMSDLMNYGIWLGNILLFMFIIGGLIILNAHSHFITYTIPIKYLNILMFLPLALFIVKLMTRFMIKG